MGATGGGAGARITLAAVEQAGTKGAPGYGVEVHTRVDYPQGQAGAAAALVRLLQKGGCAWLRPTFGAAAGCTRAATADFSPPPPALARRG